MTNLTRTVPVAVASALVAATLSYVIRPSRGKKTDENTEEESPSTVPSGVSVGGGDVPLDAADAFVTTTVLKSEFEPVHEEAPETVASDVSVSSEDTSVDEAETATTTSTLKKVDPIPAPKRVNGAISEEAPSIVASEVSVTSSEDKSVGAVATPTRKSKPSTLPTKDRSVGHDLSIPQNSDGEKIITFATTNNSEILPLTPPRTSPSKKRIFRDDLLVSPNKVKFEDDDDDEDHWC